MNVSLSPTGALAIHFSSISLGTVRPVVNDALIENYQVEIIRGFETAQTGRALLRYSAPAFLGGVFLLEIQPEPAHDRCWLHGWLEQTSDDFPIESFGLCFEGITNLRAFLRSGYHSWDGSEYAGRETLSSETASRVMGYAMTQLLPESGSGSVVGGFERHDRFQQTLTFALRNGVPALTVLTLWDQRQRDDGARCAGERLVLFEHPAVEEALREWARLVAAASPVPPRQLPARITGWCSWYNLYATITEENIQEHLRGAAEIRDRENLPLRVFQIDDGFTPEMGDWLEVKPQFPRGMKPVLDDIRTAGFAPGLWIAPFVVGNRSHLFQDHPDWVVQDRRTGGPLAQMRFYGEFRWHKRSEEYYILDTTHPDAFDYLRQVFRTWRHDWGCEYFKTDFMYFGSEYGPERAVRHAPGQTRIEVWRQVALMIREEIGDALWLGCGCPLWASVGLVDAVRIGGDVGVKWAGEQSAQSLLHPLMLRNFANAILWQADPDCILLRSRFHHLTDIEIRSLALYAGMSGGVLITSDALHELSSERLDLLKMLLNLDEGQCRYPLLGQHTRTGAENLADPVVVQIRDSMPVDGERLTAVHLFNMSEDTVQRRYALRDLELPRPALLLDGLSGAVWAEAAETIAVTLKPHESALIMLKTNRPGDP